MSPSVKILRGAPDPHELAALTAVLAALAGRDDIPVKHDSRTNRPSWTPRRWTSRPGAASWRR